MQQNQQMMGQGFPQQMMNQQQMGMMMQQPMMGGNVMGQMGYQRKPNMPMQGMPAQFPFNQMMNQGPQRPKPQYDNKLCLYIGNLTPTTFDNDLFKFFKNKGYQLRNA